MRHSASSGRAIARIAAELQRQATVLNVATDAVRQHITALSGACPDANQWREAAGEVERLTTRAAATSIAAASAGATRFDGTMTPYYPANTMRA